MQHVLSKFEISLKVLFMNVHENTGEATTDNLLLAQVVTNILLLCAIKMRK